ncbi:MAG: leucine-rich repeat protein [Clostridia bacterium]|nr:leucine-rich repeat protein [Clostridia bacterium]
MKKIFRTVLALCLLCVSAISLFACGDNDEVGEKGLILKKYNGDDFWTVQNFVDDGTTDLEIPAEKDGYPVVRIASEAFDGSKLVSIKVPTSIEEIGEGAFANMPKLKSLTLPFVGKYFNADAYANQTADGYAEPDGMDYSNVKAVGAERTLDYLFGDVVYDGGAQTAGNGKTYYLPTTLETITIAPAKDYKLPMHAFNGIKIASEIVLNDKVTEIGVSAFSNVKLDKLVVPSSVKNVYANAFEGCDIADLSFASGSQITVLPEKCFFNSKLTKIDLPASLEVIGEKCFAATISSEVSSSQLKTVKLPATITKIGYAAFQNCWELTSVDLSNVTSVAVEDYAFLECKKLSFTTEELAKFTGATDTLFGHNA